MSIPGTTVYVAKKVITMDPGRPEGTAVAVRDGRILGVGGLGELQTWGACELNDEFKDDILIPGFVEAHSHVSEGAVWGYPYVGYFDRTGPDGRRVSGCRNLEAVIARLKQANVEMTDPGATMFAWGLDPIYFPGTRMTATHLDDVSVSRPVFVFHANAHLATVNRALMTREGITRGTDVAGVMKGADGEPVGELQELPAMMLARDAILTLLRATESPQTIWNMAACAPNAGVTTYTYLGSTQLYRRDVVERWQAVVNHPHYPARASVAYGPLMGGPSDPEEVARHVASLADLNSDKLHFGQVKLVLDGSIQGFTARLGWPGYHTGSDHSQGLIEPDRLAELVLAYHRAGLTVHAHCNGYDASEAFIRAVERALREHPRWDHRHTVQHSQMTTAHQYRRMASLGMCANIFSNHIYYWGDQHYSITLGPDRASRMDACATARREDVPFAIHSDAPVTPLGGLHLMWCAVNRLTASERVLGEHERISVYDPLRAVTLDAAYTLRMDDEIGSIECGKHADFAKLQVDPFQVATTDLRDIPVLGTVVAGVPSRVGEPVQAKT